MFSNFPLTLDPSVFRIALLPCPPWTLILQSTIWLLVKVKVAQSCPTLCDPMDYIVHGILQARILEWVAFPFSRGFPTQGSNPGLLHGSYSSLNFWFLQHKITMSGFLLTILSRRNGFNPWVRKIPWRKWQPTSVILPVKSHRQRSLASHSPWGHREWDLTEQLTLNAHWIKLAQVDIYSFIQTIVRGHCKKPRL